LLAALVKVPLQQQDLLMKINIYLNAQKINLKCTKQTVFLLCFLIQKWVLADRTLDRENDNSGSIDLCCSGPHTAHPIP